MVNNKLLDFKLENVTPILNVKSMSQSVAFYVGILGFTNAQWGDDHFTQVSRDNVGLYLCTDGQGCSGTWIWMGFDGDIMLLHQQLITRGVKIKMPPTKFSCAYEMQIEDPDGHVMRFGTDPSGEK